MKKTFAAFLALCAIPTLAQAATDDELRSMIIGTWSDRATCENGTLTFNADGTFGSSGTEPDGSDGLKGTFQIVGGKLAGTSGGEAMPEATISFEGETLVFATQGRTDRLVHCTAPANPAQ